MAKTYLSVFSRGLWANKLRTKQQEGGQRTRKEKEQQAGLRVWSRQYLEEVGITSSFLEGRGPSTLGPETDTEKTQKEEEAVPLWGRS